MRTPSVFVACVLCVIASGCKDKAKEPPTPGSGSVLAEPAKPKPKPVVPKPFFVSVDGRQGKCEFLKYEGDGKKRKAMFKITPPPGKEVSSVQTWEFYYDKSGKHLSRYPHATAIYGESQALGHEGDSIPKDTDVIECEVSRMNFKDETMWFNENLVPDSGRPKGGVPDADLKAKSGEKVEVEIVDGKAGKVKLKNVSDKPVKSADINLLYRMPKGAPRKTEYRSDWLRDTPIKPGATVEYTLKLKDAPSEFASVEGYAPTVRFEDSSEFNNPNLSSSYR
jgi:hypothetical protein